ncbi:hypothetical protein LshimejAT787_2600420 [Lyophyllum shimeji]|uniref:Uncharacterized protein n=1 Tax=Lyophyllum shimeji TaxID=47721 RepID=A0A9P3Q1Z8_LYOSH|nr:hypothetical protein LshimejAT787_2600420 [Lyophyllum shimeji]
MVAAHLISYPAFMSVSLPNGAAKATVFLALDTSASVTMTLNADASAGATVQSTTGAASKCTSRSVNGCGTANGALNVDAGGDASFFGLFDPSTKVSLSSKNAELFNRCLGAQKREVATVVRRRGPNRCGTAERYRRSVFRPARMASSLSPDACKLRGVHSISGLASFRSNSRSIKVVGNTGVKTSREHPQVPSDPRACLTDRDPYAMKLAFPLAVSLPLITCRAATVTLYYVSAGTNGMTTYLDRVVESMFYYQVKPNGDGTTFTASDGSVITSEAVIGPIQTFTTTPVTMDGTLVADASHLVYHKDPSPTNTLDPGGNKLSCDFDGRGGGACVNEFWFTDQPTATTTWSGSAVPLFTLVVQGDGGKINGASPSVVVGWGLVMVGILFGAFQVL